MPSYDLPPVRPAMLPMPLVFGRRPAPRAKIFRPVSSAAVMTALVVFGLVIGLAGGSSPSIAAEATSEQAQSAASPAAETEATAPTEGPAVSEEPAEESEAAEPEMDRLEAEPAEGEPEAGKAEAEPAEAEPSDAEDEGPGLDSLSEKSLLELLAGGKTTLSILDDNPEETRIQKGFGRTLYTLLVAVLSLAAVIGPFYLAVRFTKEWREPLWAWPLGLVLFVVAAVAAALAGRFILSLLEPVYGYDFLRFLLHVVLFRNLWIAVALVAVSIWVGNFLSRRWRMPDHAVRIGVVFFALVAGVTVTVLGWPPNLGIDLSGGVILVYDLEGKPGSPKRGGEAQEQEGQAEEDEEDRAAAGGTQQVDMDKLIQAIRLRVDPSNTRELTIRKYGERQIEVIIPQADEEELARIKGKISSAGTLEFRILANRQDHSSLIQRAEELEGWDLNDSSGEPEAWWVPVARGKEEDLLGFSTSAETVFRKKTYRGYEWTEFLVVKDPFDITGGYLVNARESIDQSGRPCVLFTFNHAGGQRFGALTGDNRPREADGFSRHLGIILDGYLMSAPSIRTTIFRQGEITGDFTRQEVQDNVDILNAGSLPTALSERPVSETFMGPGLGQDTIERGRIAIVVSMVLVLLFMLYYYRFAGAVACFALLMNVVLILAVMITVRAAFTLPGLAGLVLTVGMAVDANVLIFERMREELNRQATLRMAIRNGFSRATTTIVDANLTTLIVAIVLYVIGTDQIRGFAVILVLGVVLSMFTAIYCARLFFDVAEKQKWITKVNMAQMLGKTEFDFLGKRRVAAAASIAVIAIGLASVVGRGAGLLDIDFIGGVSVRVVFHENQDIADLRSKLGEEGEGLQDLSVMNVATLGAEEANREFIVNTSGLRNMEEGIEPNDVLDEVKSHLETAFGDALVHRAMTVSMLPSEGERAEPGEGGSSNGDEGTAEEKKAQSRAKLVFEPFEPISDSGDASVEDSRHKVTHDTLKGRIDEEIKRQGLLAEGTIDYTLSNPQYVALDSEAPYAEWEVALELAPDKAEALLAAVEERFESEPFFPSSNTIGGQVAGKTRVDAIMALLASLVFIVGYIWIRFQRVMFGLAAVVALVHDVLITLGVIAITAYIAAYTGPLANLLLIEEFKIGLPVLAAFLTIIGYSLNDTIVVFDRIREVRGKAPQLTETMINASINQTLSRTLLTSLTTLLVVVVLYIGGGQGIHVFAFALVVGVVVGTYSSIFVASPMLYWMANASRSGRKGQAAATSK